ncbi:MAG: nucleotide sugar dehydrogenase [Gemmatimonadota bacterium]|nr:nucleotide sugar dehydrogenase [Gemmatimonadota bacterium]
MDNRRVLKEKIESGDATVGVLGLGYVGLPVVVAFAEAGYRTVGFDVSQGVVDLISRGDSHIGDVSPESVAAVVEDGLLRATTDFAELRDMDVIIICVPTPLSKTGDPDVSYIVRALESIEAALRPGQLVILESTTYPGTTRDLVQPRLEETGLVAGSDFFLAFSPERVDPGNATYQLKNTPKVVGGLTPACHELATAAYARVIDSVVEVSSPEAAELTKILENTFRAVNIGLVNEMAVICDRLGIDIWEVVDAASTKPYGYMRFTPGPGLGGHCIPIDPHYLAWKMRTLEYRTRFIELAAEVNAEMPRYVVSRVAEALNHARKAVNGSRILLLGVSYKRDVGDTRESPALDIIQLLAQKGAELVFHDPYVAELRRDDGPTMTSVELTASLLATADCVVVTCDHSGVDYDLVLDNAAIIVDPRNGLGGKTGRGLIYPIAGPPRSNDAPEGAAQPPVDVAVSSA